MLTLRFHRGFLTTALVGTLSGCAHFVCPARGGPAWREIQSEHFVVRTDLESEPALKLARELEGLYGSIRAVLVHAPAARPDRIHVVAFRSKDEFDEVGPSQAAAYYDFSEFDEPTIVLPDGLGTEQRSVVAHEITHHIASRMFVHMPLWMHEGLASFMETAGSRIDGDHTRVGVPPAYLYVLAKARRRPMREILTTDKKELSRAGYATAWALVHYLFNVHPERAPRLLERFARGEEPAAAWREVFPEWDPDDSIAIRGLDREIANYLANGSYNSFTVPIDLHAEARERMLSPGTGHDVRISLRYRVTSKHSSWRAIEAEADEALAEDPGNVGAIAWRLRNRERGGLELARAAVDRHPEDARSWFLLGKTLPDGEPGAREEALRHATTADSPVPRAYGLLAVELERQRRAQEGLTVALEGVTAAPWSAAAFDSVAAVLRSLERCEEARLFEQRAIDLAWGREDDEDEVRAFSAHFAELEKCAAAPVQR